WHSWWSKSRYLDDHAAFFSSWLRKGEHVIEYAVRAEALGVSSAMPAVVYPMYQPEVSASTGIDVLEVTAK
ncbi:MAG: hypothetical protein IH945_00285, partial [Armatimonadetes bacterium]|nr:hypothetical protein [Armatimonadota bacterium]